ncbi:MAG: alkaline phosphatase family protein [Actinomycetota bacterium]|nr:alkaline phosphatase family protein [Actinomycetota bacterium]
MRSRTTSLAASLLVLASVAGIPADVVATHKKSHKRTDQGLNRSEERAFRKSLRALMENDNVDMVITMRRYEMGKCPFDKRVYWVYSRRGTICFKRKAAGHNWRFDVERLEGKNPLKRQSHTALATYEKERAASPRVVEDTGEPRNLVGRRHVTYPYAYERIVAEFDSPKTGDFVIVPLNTADRGGPGAHGHLGVSQSRTTLLVAGRGARRSPLSARAERKLRTKNVDVAPTVAKALGVNRYFADTGKLGTWLNGTKSKKTLLRRQDGRVLDELLEPVFNTFVISVDGLEPKDVTSEKMPNLTGLLEARCRPGGACATQYKQARAMMVSETNGNHVAMVTGAYGEDSGIFANESYDRDAGEPYDLDRPELNFSPTLFDAIERHKPWLRTALIMGKSKLRTLFDCTRNAQGECGTSSDNPEGVPVRHLAPDIVAGANDSPSDPQRDCPTEPGSGSGYTTNDCVMDRTLDILAEKDPDFTFVNLPEVDAFSHLAGPNTPIANEKVRDADMQIGRLVDALRESNRWQHSVVIVTADHNFGNTRLAEQRIYMEEEFSDAGPSPLAFATHGGSGSVYLDDLEKPNRPLTRRQQRTLAEVRKQALELEGVEEVLYRRPNPLDDGRAHTIDNVHPHWRLGGTARVGELLIVGEENYAVLTSQLDDDNAVIGHHGHATDRHVPFIVASGGTYVRDRVVKAERDLVDERDDTGRLRNQAETVDVAETISWLLKVKPPRDSDGRMLDEAFAMHPMRAHRRGLITEPIANRAAIFIYDQNNSVNVWCLLRAQTCGDPIPPEAQDETFIPTLRSLAKAGTLLRYGSMSAWPTVTFPNHNTVGSGAYPGHHGVPNNRFYRRKAKETEQPIDPTNPSNLAYQGTSALLSKNIETLHEAIHRTFGDWTLTDGPTSDKAYTASVDEPSARGADYATLEADSSFPHPLEYMATPDPTEFAQDTTQSCAQAYEGYFVESTLDHEGQTQARRLYQDNVQHPLPKYLINNFTLTDGAGHHFGAHAICTLAAYRDSDRRLTRILQAMESAGVLGETLIVVTGDHGAENQDLEKRGLPSDFSDYLNERNIKHVMTDWHVYLLGTDLRKTEPKRFVRGVTTEAVFTVTDNDTGDPVADAVVKVMGLPGEAEGTTDDEGRVTLELTPEDRRFSVIVTHEDFNKSIRFYKVRAPGGER